MAVAQQGGGTRGEPEALPITVEAQRIEGRPDVETVAEGEVELTRGDVSIRADRIRYIHPEDLARATGNVRVTQDGKRFSGPELQLQTERYEGFFTRPSYYFDLLGAGGQAERVDFLGKQHVHAHRATWSSCTPDEEGSYAWLLTARRVELDFEKNEGVATGAVLRFYNVPILAVPWLSFPLGDERKSGWLPPTVNLDSRSGLEVAVPYYWNIAPNLDATFTPTVISKRGAALGNEFRYLTPRHQGVAGLFTLPQDQLTGDSRFALALDHRGRLPADVQYQLSTRRVSDDEYWKDFPRWKDYLPNGADVLTPRLLPTLGRLDWWQGDWSLYARVQDWQVLQDPAALIDPPYARAPQVGLRFNEPPEWAGWRVDFEGEVNRFERPHTALVPNKVEGLRLHALSAISRRFGGAGWYAVPRLSLNAASYSLDQPLADGRYQASRAIPGLSIEGGLVFERDLDWFGRPYQQTLEPRLLYVNRPYRRQDHLPNFDSAPLDEHLGIFSEYTFSGIDRVADTHQVNAGLSTRYFNAASGAQVVELHAFQRFLLRDQQITPSGQPYTNRLGDLFLLGTTSLVRNWTLGGTAQYSHATQRVERVTSVLRYSPGAFRTINLDYNYARNASGVIVGWQWPVFGPARRPARTASGQGCDGGSVYSVGRFNYSTREHRIVDSILGLEYDAGCWIGRFVTSRTSTGQAEAITRLLFQIEFVGLSRLGSSPVSLLKANIPGYRLLRE